MNNFVFSQDPILCTPTVPQYQTDPQEMKKQLDVIMAQYQNLQQSVNNQEKLDSQTYSSPSKLPYDYLGEIDGIIADLTDDEREELNADAEFTQLYTDIQGSIQREIVESIKWKINSDKDNINKFKEMKGIVDDIKKKKEKEQKQSLAELNDYIQNYSDMTFNEYKKIKMINDESR